jgi:hypothetical protein
MMKLVLAIILVSVLAGCGAKRGSPNSIDACPGFAPGPITITSCPG